MNEWLFLSLATLVFSVFIVLGWWLLPGERWQMLASVPWTRRSDTTWTGINLTSYGLLVATSALISIVFVLLLTGSTATSLLPVLVTLFLAVAICVPASRLIARWVEKKPHTFTVGGAFFCGLAIIPVLVLLVNTGCRFMQSPPLDMAMMLAAISIGYVLGEGLGRLACISFGCCYGKPLAQCHRFTALLFDRVAFVFSGTTQKAVYEGGFKGVKLVPIQGLTSMFHTITALIATHLFFQGAYGAAFLLCLIASQAWRIVSEVLRADFRGGARISAYQKMGGAAILYSCGLTLLLPSSSLPPPDITRGLGQIADPLLLLGLQVLWFLLFVFFGRSMVTGATLSFEVHRDRI
ncbi:prolipoprotein diacylglyceryl transferase family protein [Desulfobulbus alkaliphilus]|uniref:prolipoprotein diacylglyceryl transferase family protein n=1 Tax=Desulfobulbus alkaliphilus TaxID=869814 RepID=UPI0019644F7A|nr:prolipoprotein diacylglyceryl transferase family protein [Desulfobulbus alkaliphilus]MBM9536097.1 prolipoprotein diacylglyceryl transferase [Desulfobulbus alkaliphilus]